MDKSITVIGLDLAKSVFRFTGSTRRVRLSSVANLAGLESSPISIDWNRAWLAWKPAQRRTIGAVS